MCTLKNGDATYGKCAHDLNHCRAMLKDLSWEVVVAHVYQKGNRAADWLANRSVIQNNRVLILDRILAEFSRILEDIRGVAFSRLVPP